ncbi:peptidoglycan D,D-transpeptidase FtsI family protein [Salinarimonas ramus]|uniref:Penicillin-binding protein n=1 Tax=Salinarimonas ramus TaxID=690164 RepID=A0A917V4E8_9HYPH|nr:penicillin-binding protein 2 [Salinarimonas ramus]GGK35747.1 penicillin-binding protein [Salinarimonas ramus]
MLRDNRTESRAEPREDEDDVHPAEESREARPGFVGRLFQMRADKSRARIALGMVCFGALFAVIAGRLVMLGIEPDAESGPRRAASSEIGAVRPDILDRNGEILATDITMVSVFAEPRNIIDPDEATELLTAVFPDLDATKLRDELSTDRGFIWVKREITPRQQAEVHALGIPGVGFLPENKRVYPNGVAAAHVLGFANIDNVGIAGIEQWIDREGLVLTADEIAPGESPDLEPVRLALDLRVQHAMREELVAAVEKFSAIAAAGLVLDVRTGEIISLVSLPDFDPNVPTDALQADRINRINVGVYEMGSVMKAVTTAMALESGRFTINSVLDARGSLRFGRQSISDYRGENRPLTVPEVFIHSSNIGTARMALTLGADYQREFLRELGLMDRLRTELAESAAPLLPPRWGDVTTATVSFGHGIAVQPLSATMATAAMVNGGYLIPPTFLQRSEDDAQAIADQVISRETSEALRYVMRLNAEQGSARSASVAGFYIGGKTGTAEKVVNGRYDSNRRLNTFFAVAPADDPRYLFLTILDEPKALPETHGFATSGWNAAPTTGKIIERVAPMLDIPPRFDPPAAPFPTMARLGAWGTTR